MNQKFKTTIIPIILLSFLTIGVIVSVYKTVPQRQIILGVWTEGMFDPKTQKLHPEKLIEFEQLTQKKVSIAHYYRGWEALTDPELITEFDTLRSHGWEPMINVNPYYFSQCPSTDLPLYKAIAEGKCDKFLHNAGKNLSKVKKPFYFLFAWEMNNQELEWSVTRSGSSPRDFVAAWQHIYNVFAQENANNIIWVFCPNVPDVATLPYNEIYPGDKFVDWTALDGYNWGTTQSWSQWSSFSGVFTSSYRKMVNITPHKPMMLAEVNTTDQGGDKGAWYTDMFTKQLPYNFPQIKAVVIFNEDRSKQEHVNWKVDITPESLRNYISSIHSHFYK